MHDIYTMRTQHVIHATGSLRKFLIARSMGAAREELVQLSAQCMAELETERAARRSSLDDVVADHNLARADKPPIVDTNAPPDNTP